MKVLSINLVLNVETDNEAYDAVNEILREQQDDFAMNSSLVDYAIASTPRDLDIKREDYSEGDAFNKTGS